MEEIARVLKKGGQLFISDPTPNENDTSRFIDIYMKMKPDGHIKFYTEHELVTLSNSVGLSLVNSFRTVIRFPRKNAAAYSDIIAQTDRSIIDEYGIVKMDDEIYITEQVMNLSFEKIKSNTRN